MATNAKDTMRQVEDDFMAKYRGIDMIMMRGLGFVVELSQEADAHYAGKGVSLGAPGTPIFWYLPKDAKKYRVIYADLSVREADTPPRLQTPGLQMARFLVNFLTFGVCLTIAILAMFHLSCWAGIVAMIVCLFLSERAGLLR